MFSCISNALTESLCDLNERLDIISIANIDYDNVLIVCNVEHSIFNFPGFGIFTQLLIIRMARKVC